MHLVLVRHGESLGNAAGVLQGRLDYALSDRGLRQAELTAVRLAEFKATRVLSSPLLRASATAALVADALGLDLQLEPDLAEYDIGEGAGLTGPELRAKFPEMLAARSWGAFRFPRRGEGDFHHVWRGAAAVSEMMHTIAVAPAAFYRLPLSLVLICTSWCVHAGLFDTEVTVTRRALVLRGPTPIALEGNERR